MSLLPLTGNFESHKFTGDQFILKGSGDYGNSNIVLECKNSSFVMSMGTKTLMTVTPDTLNDYELITYPYLEVSSNLFVTDKITLSDNSGQDVVLTAEKLRTLFVNNNISLS